MDWYTPAIDRALRAVDLNLNKLFDRFQDGYECILGEYLPVSIACISEFLALKIWISELSKRLDNVPRLIQNQSLDIFNIERSITKEFLQLT